MLPPAERSSTSASLLTVRSHDRAWGLPGAAVTGVELFESDKHGRPLDVLELLEGIATSREDESARVLHLAVDGQHLSLLTRGALTLLESSAYQLLPMPRELGSVAPLVSHVALIDGKPSLLVISPERLLALDLEKRALFAAPPPDQGSSC
jgi:hypothetical protein